MSCTFGIIIAGIILFIMLVTRKSVDFTISSFLGTVIGTFVILFGVGLFLLNCF